MKRVAVISADAELSRFFELELRALGFEVSVAADTSALSVGYDFLFVDTVTVRTPVHVYGCPVVSVYPSGTETDGKGTSISYPASVSDIRDVCLSLLTFDTVASVREREAADTVYVLDGDAGTVVFDGRRIDLSRTELAILTELCTAEGETVSREHIMALMGAERGNISDVYICRLRGKLETEKRLIFTERGVGYRTVLKMRDAQQG